MKRILMLLCLILPVAAMAQKDGENLERYLAGAVPVVDGKVVFTHHIDIIPGYTQEQIYSIGRSWLVHYMEEVGFKGKKLNNIVEEDAAAGQVKAVICRYLVFKKNAFVLDRCHMMCSIVLKCDAEGVSVEMGEIRYNYNDGEKIMRPSAEEYITDENALAKEGTKLAFVTGKFRKATVDAADGLAASLDKAFDAFRKREIMPNVAAAPKAM